ncbi:MAG: hypothetical protein JSR89_02615 [Proteobacteria bacterium]|nr:hypothetical protein [Pseudomonadota bacterium]
MNTVIAPSGNSAEPELFEDALIELVEEGAVFIEMTGNRWPRDWRPKDDGRSLAQNLSDYYVFDLSERIWKDSRFPWQADKAPSEPRVELTDAGQAKSIELLQERGYEWWRQPKVSSALLNNPGHDHAAESESNPETKRHVVYFRDAETGEISPLSIYGTGLYAKVKAYLADRAIVETPSTSASYSSVYIISRKELRRLYAAFHVPWY